VDDLYLEIDVLGDLAWLCNRYGVVPDGICKVSVIFIREPLTQGNYSEKLQEPGADSRKARSMGLDQYDAFTSSKGVSE